MSTLEPWFRYFAVQDSITTEKWLNHKTAVTWVSPPPGPGGMEYPGPIDPATIADPVARKDYEERIAENERRRQQSLELHDLMQGSLHAGSFFWLWANGFFASSPEELQHAQTEAEKAGCSPDRVAWLRAVLASKGFPPPEPLLEVERQALKR